MIGAGAGACGAATGSGATPSGAICGITLTSTPVGAGGIGGKAPKSGIAGGIGKSKPGMLDQLEQPADSELALLDYSIDLCRW